MGEENLKTSPEEIAEAPKASKKQPKMIGKIRQSYLVAAVIVVVLAVAGGGFWAVSYKHLTLPTSLRV